MIAAHRDDDTGTDSGSAYVWSGLTTAVCDGLAVTVIGTDGPDVMVGTVGPDVIVGLGGDDDIDPGRGDDVVCAGDGNDLVRPSGGRIGSTADVEPTCSRVGPVMISCSAGRDGTGFSVVPVVTGWWATMAVTNCGARMV